MTKTSGLDKAKAYLAEGRVKVMVVQGGLGGFSVQGSDSYYVLFDPKKGWHCECPAHVEECAHVLACQLITNLKLDAHIQLGTPNEEISALLAD